MSTEDDTFRILRRMPFSQLDQEYYESSVLTSKERTIWFEERGWKWSEYTAILEKIIESELNKRYDGR